VWTAAEIKIGRELAKMPKAKGGAAKGVGRRGKQCGPDADPHSAATLNELGVSMRDKGQGFAGADTRSIGGL